MRARPAELLLPAAGRTAYNQPVVLPFLSLRTRRFVAALLAGGLTLAPALLLLAGPLCARAQDSGSGAAGPADAGRILLVLPFDNGTNQPSLEWIREAAAEILTSRLRAAGFDPLSREDRRYALDHLGMPQDFHPSRATSIKLAETLDADSILVGSYTIQGGDIVAEAQVADVPRLHMGPEVTARGKMTEMVSVFDLLAWKLARQLDPAFSGSQQTFMAVGAGLRLDAFEQYIRGITEPDQQERLRHLNLAVQLSPGFSSAWMALGREDYNDQQYEQAAAAFAKVGSGGVGSSSDDLLEAEYYRGLALLFSGDYVVAEEAFADVARELPLAEVLNNQGVALARQGKDAGALFRKALAADPSQADYHFNLALSLKRRGDAAAALAELEQCLHLRPTDSEALAVEQVWTGRDKASAPKPAAPTPPSAANTASADNPGSAGATDDTNDPDSPTASAEAVPDPLERIERGFDATAFRQAAQMINQMEEARLATLPPPERAQKLAAQANVYLDRGLLLEAERLDLSALAADRKSAAAHTGLAEVRERTGNAKAARQEAETSLRLEPSAAAYLVLERLDLAEGRREQAVADLDAVLKLDPQNAAARELRRQIGSDRER